MPAGLARPCKAILSWRGSHLQERKRFLASLDSRAIPQIGHLALLDAKVGKKVVESFQIDVRIWEESILIHQLIAQFLPFAEPIYSIGIPRHEGRANDPAVIQNFSEQVFGARVVHPLMLEHAPVLAEPLNKQLTFGSLALISNWKYSASFAGGSTATSSEPQYEQVPVSVEREGIKLLRRPLSPKHPAQHLMVGYSAL